MGKARRFGGWAGTNIMQKAWRKPEKLAKGRETHSLSILRQKEVAQSFIEAHMAMSPQMFMFVHSMRLDNASNYANI